MIEDIIGCLVAAAFAWAVALCGVSCGVLCTVIAVTLVAWVIDEAREMQNFDDTQAKTEE